MPRFIKPTIAIAITMIIIAVVFFFIGRAAAERAPDDWAEEAKTQALQPCFGNAIFVNLGAQIIAKQWEMSDEERAELEAAGRIIPEGHHEGIVIPERCFAVAQGLYGFTVTFWERPRTPAGDPDMSIPYWTPVKYSHSREAIMADHDPDAG